MNEIIDSINLDKIPNGSKHTFKLNLIKNALGDYLHIPVMIAKGKPGKTVGMTAAIHGNELNGIPTIHSIWEKIDVKSLIGTLILVPVINVPGFMNGTREFHDGKDLNRIMPGKPYGTSSERYAYQLIEKLVSLFELHFDLHTASEGRINSYYIKADLNDITTAKLTGILSPEIIVNSAGPKGSFRGACEKKGIPSLTLELGDPNMFQIKHIKPAYYGLLRCLNYLSMLPEIDNDDIDFGEDVLPIMCASSHWYYTKHGGILSIKPNLTDFVEKGQIIANIKDVFGKKVCSIKARQSGYIIGKSTYPVCHEGSRVIHLGIPN